MIRCAALAIGPGAASAREIDRINIYHASVLAMRRALARLVLAPHHVVVDGNPVRTLGVAHRAVVGGDGRCYCVACASIIAKVTRDRLMRRWGRATRSMTGPTTSAMRRPAHLAGIDRHGISPHHRRRFWRVAQTMLALGDAVVDLATEVDRRSRWPTRLALDGVPGRRRSHDSSRSAIEDEQTAGEVAAGA